MTLLSGSSARSKRPSSIRSRACSRRSSGFWVSSPAIGTPPPVAAYPAPAAMAGAGAAAAGVPASASEKSNVCSIDVLFMVSARLSIAGPRENFRRPRGDVFPLPQLVTHDPHFEKQRRCVDAAPDVVEIRRAYRRRTVHDFEKAAFELVEDAGDRSLGRLHGVAPVET